MNTAEQITIFEKAREITEDRWKPATLGEGDVEAPCCINGALMEARGIAPDYSLYDEDEHRALCATLIEKAEIPVTPFAPDDNPEAYVLESWNDTLVTADYAEAVREIREAGSDSYPPNPPSRKENTEVLAALDKTISALKDEA